jgi:hypothetical protein
VSCSLQFLETLARVVRSRVAGDEVTGVKKGQTCPRCSAFATIEPGGLRCSRCGYTPIFRRILPCTHQLSGRDWRNRERQRALDRTLIRAGRMEEVLFELLERLEGRQEPVVATAWNREHRGVAPRIRDDDELTGDAGRFRWNSDLTAEERKAAIESGLVPPTTTGLSDDERKAAAFWQRKKHPKTKEPTVAERTAKFFSEQTTIGPNGEQIKTRRLIEM